MTRAEAVGELGRYVATALEILTGEQANFAKQHKEPKDPGNDPNHNWERRLYFVGKEAVKMAGERIKRNVDSIINGGDDLLKSALSAARSGRIETMEAYWEGKDPSEMTRTLKVIALISSHQLQPRLGTITN